MLRRCVWLTIFLCSGTVSALQSPSQPTPAPVAATKVATAASATVTVRLQTELGPIILTIDREHAPLTAANFLHYVEQKRLDGTTFYRALKLEGRSDLGLIQAGTRGDSKRVLKPIAHESTLATGLSHTDGALSMARAGVGTATGDFFIVIGDLSSLDAKPADPASGQAEDAGYAVFGRVTEGMDVVHALLEQPVDAGLGPEGLRGQMLAKPVKILTARRMD